MPVKRFAEMLQTGLMRKNFNQTEFARLVGCSSGWLSNILYDRHRPPGDLATLQAWANALGLTNNERQEFIEEALLQHTPEPIEMEYRKMRERLNRRRTTSS